MAFLQTIREPEGQAAAAALTAQLCIESGGYQAEENAAQNLHLWIWPGSATGKPIQDLEQSKRNMGFILHSSAQDDSVKRDLGATFHCVWFQVSNLPEYNKYRMEAMAMAVFRGFWVSKKLFCAVAKLIAQYCVGSKEGLTDGFATNRNPDLISRADLVIQMTKKLQMSPDLIAYSSTNRAMLRSGHGPIEQAPLRPDRAPYSMNNIAGHRLGHGPSDLELCRADPPLYRPDLETHSPEKTTEDKKKLSLY